MTSPRVSPRIVVDAGSAGLRLEAFVARVVGSSVGRARRGIADGLVRVDGRRLARGAHLVPGQTVEIASTLVAADGAVIGDATAPLEVLHLDEHIVAVDKPAGMPSHPLRAAERGTLGNALCARFPECASASPDPREAGLGHRLDRGTSGVLIAARSRAAWLGLRAALRGPECRKTYLAEVVGVAPAAGRITAAIGRRGRRGSRVVLDGGRAPRAALTEFVRLGSGEHGLRSLVRAELHAGRPHQIRAHLASIGHPIVGDGTYGALPQGGTEELHLHAESVALRHPVSGAPLVITGPPPAWALRYLT